MIAKHLKNTLEILDAAGGIATVITSVLGVNWYARTFHP